MADYEADDNKQQLENMQEKIDEARKKSSDRSEKVDDLTSRFRELRRRNHFALMLEEIFNE
jgi:hypothetical protein